LVRVDAAEAMTEGAVGVMAEGTAGMITDSEGVPVIDGTAASSARVTTEGMAGPVDMRAIAVSMASKSVVVNRGTSDQ